MRREETDSVNFGNEAKVGSRYFCCSVVVVVIKTLKVILQRWNQAFALLIGKKVEVERECNEGAEAIDIIRRF